MPIIIVAPIEVEDDKSLVNVSILDRPYPQLAKQGNKIRCLINRIFTEDGNKITKQPRLIDVFMVYKPIIYSPTNLNITPYALFQGIPKGYFVELLAINFIYSYEDNPELEFPIYPGEMQTNFHFSTPHKIKEIVQADIQALTKVGEAFETVGLLHQMGLYDIAGDLTEGLQRMERNDHEGAIKFFRKVLEGWRVYINSQKKTIASVKRTEEVNRFLNTSYSLMSNFGEHTGTHGWIDEATLSKEIAVSISRYILSSLK